MFFRSFLKLPFKRSFIILIGVGSALCATFVVLNIQQPPRIRHTAVDESLVARQQNERLTMAINQPINTVQASQITISPQAKFSVATSGEVVTVQFTERLRYNTTYKVQLQSVQSTYQPAKKVDLATTFTTADPTYFYLRRNPELDPAKQATKQPDQIIRATLNSKSETVILSAPQIQEYVVAGKYLAAVTINATAKTSQLYIIDLTNPKQKVLPLPATGTISRLRAAPHTSNGTSTIGFRFTSNEPGTKKYENLLFTADLAKSAKSAKSATDTPVRQVKGLDGQELQVTNWEFAPDGTTILAQTFDTNLLIIDTTNKHQPVPLGQYSFINNFSYNGAKLIVDKGGNQSLLDILNKKYDVLPDETIEGVKAYAQTSLALSNSDGYIIRLAAFSNNEYRHYLVLRRGTERKQIYAVPVAEQSLETYDTSPNDQLLALEVSAADNTQFDNYLDNGRPINIRTRIIDIGSGRTLKDVDGFSIIWQ